MSATHRIWQGVLRQDGTIGPEPYRGWKISFDPPPIPVRSFDWSATHPDYDAEWLGEEDGWQDNGLSVRAESYEELCALIDEKEAELAEERAA
jgi:hypothetical protein